MRGIFEIYYTQLSDSPLGGALRCRGDTRTYFYNLYAWSRYLPPVISVLDIWQFSVSSCTFSFVFSCSFQSFALSAFSSSISLLLISLFECPFPKHTLLLTMTTKNIKSKRTNIFPTEFTVLLFLIRKYNYNVTCGKALTFMRRLIVHYICRFKNQANRDTLCILIFM